MGYTTMRVSCYFHADCCSDCHFSFYRNEKLRYDNMDTSIDKLQSLTIDQQNKLRAISKSARIEITSSDSDKAITEILNKYEQPANALLLPKFRSRDWLVLCIQIIDKEAKQ